LRIAKQFNRDPKELANELVTEAMLAIDDTLADNCDVGGNGRFALSCVSRDREPIFALTISGLMEALPPTMIAQFTKESKKEGLPVQCILKERLKEAATLDELQ
jgi:hypothetical protein